MDAFAGWLRSKYGVLPACWASVIASSTAGRVLPDRRSSRQQVLAELRELVPLAPLHQPYNLAAIEAVFARLPGVPQVACFDTSFHRGQPAVAELVPLPREIRQAGVQRYGFHGLSYEYIASVLPQVAPEIAGGRVIVAHLGSGASMLRDARRERASTARSASRPWMACAWARGPAALDPGVVLHLFQGLKLSASEVETILYKKSGLLGISGISNDMRHLLGRTEPEARLAVDYFVYRAAKEIGALAAVLGGVDAVVFTAGIGENSAEIRQRICEASAWLGIALDHQANAAGGPRITTPTQQGLGLGDSHQRGADDRPPHRPPAGPGVPSPHGRGLG